MRARRFTRGWLIAAAALLALAAPASAATTLGNSPGGSGSGGENCGGNHTFFPTSEESLPYTAPFDGVLVSWTMGDDWAASMKLKVGRPAGGSNLTIVAEDGPRAIPHGGATYPIRIPVRQGDKIGLYLSTTHYCFGGGTAGDSYGIVAGDPAVGSNAPVSPFFAGGRIGVQAQLEQDADGDGYGDETQDLCPSVASTQGPCPLPTVLGQNFAPSAGSIDDFTYVVTGSPGVISAAQRDGVITSWSYQTGATVNPGTVQLKLFRALGGNSYRAVAEDEPRTPVAGTVNTYSTRIPIHQDDKIGIHSTGPRVISNALAAANSMATAPGNVPVGSSAAFTPTTSVGRKVDVSAVMEADADGDGYGDTTQDLCPTDPSTQGQCPVDQPPPPDDTKCDAARKKLDKAKAKLKKLKKNDAAAKQIKKAKGNVKSAKAAVKKAC